MITRVALVAAGIHARIAVDGGVGRGVGGRGPGGPVLLVAIVCHEKLIISMGRGWRIGHFGEGFSDWPSDVRKNFHQSSPLPPNRGRERGQQVLGGFLTPCQ